MIICLIISISSVSAADLNQTNSTIDLSLDDSIVNVEEEVPDVPDLVVNDTIYINADNIDDYFTNGILESKFNDKTLIFNQNFENLGRLIIHANNVTVKSSGYILKNTVFQVDAGDVTLSDINLDLDSQFKDNDGSAIQVFSDDVNLINVNINYIVPQNVEAYGIYAEGRQGNPLRNLKIKNSYINFEGHNDNVNVYNCALKLIDCRDALIENNTIHSALPLKDIIFGANGAELASDLVLTVGIEGCNNITFIKNSLFAEVNKRPENLYPSLDCMLISKSDNSLICNNSIFMTDFLTYPGTDNYIYGLDIYNLNNITVCHNDISIITTGGKMAAGTAYPIQVTGPIDGVNITDNDLYSFSNGPNIGIYSQNYYGATALSITNNRINVTGLAGVHEWALVAGIESQDSNSIIRNNTIEVHSVGNVDINDNIYGVSYRQHTAGNHTFDIQNNTVFSDGFYSVSILDSVDSTIANNLLVSFNEKASNSNNGYNYGSMASHRGDEFYNNRVIRYNDYFASINNEIDGGEEFTYDNPTNDKGLTNEIDGNSIGSKDDRKSYNYNPLIPGSSNKGKDTRQNDGDTGKDDSKDNNGNGDGVGPHGGSGNSSGKFISLSDLLSEYMDSNTDNGGKANSTHRYDGSRSNVRSNNTDSTPSDAGPDVLSSESESQSEVAATAGSSGKSSLSKAFELEDLTKNQAFIPSVIVVLIILMLLVVGYRRRNSKFD